LAAVHFIARHIHNFIDPNARVERVLSIDAAVVICFTWPGITSFAKSRHFEP